MAKKVEILNPEVIQTKIKRIALELWEKHSNEEELILIGIKSGGYTLASYIKDHLDKISDLNTSLISLTMDKKNMESQPSLSSDMSLRGKAVVLIDDVANSGKTLGYALMPIMSQLPKRVMIAVLIERMHKAFPFKAEVIGHEVATTIQDEIKVVFNNNNQISVFLQ